jgi:8-oxo-dGTP pyrophosphatase MutT (NUDIX family)
MSDLIKFKELVQKIFKTDNPPTKIIDGKEVFNFDGLNEKIGVICLVFYEDKLLLVERSGKVDSPNIWHPVSGYYDRFVESTEIATNELAEEVGITSQDAYKVKAALETFTGQLGSVLWHMFPVIIHLTKVPEIILNAESNEARFVKIDELDSLNMNPLVREFARGEFQKHLEEIREDRTIE